MRYLFFGFWFSLALPSVGLFKKAGLQWALAYIIFSVIGVWAILLLF